MKKQPIIIAITAIMAAGMANAQMFAQMFGNAETPVTLTFTYVSVYPASVVLHANYPGPAKPDKAMWNSGDGWHSFTSKTIPLHSPVLRFRGDWRDSYGRLYQMFNSTFPAASGMVRMAGGFDVSGAPAPYMFAYTFQGDTGLTGSIPAGLFGDLSGAPAASMFAYTFQGDSGLTGSIPAGLFGAISGAPAPYMFYSTFSGDTGLTGSSATMPDGTTKLWEQFPTAASTQCDNCYLNASGLSDYATIPEAWK